MLLHFLTSLILLCVSYKPASYFKNDLILKVFPIVGKNLVILLKAVYCIHSWNVNIAAVSKNTERSSTAYDIEVWMGHIPSCPAWLTSCSFTIAFKPLRWQLEFNSHCSKSSILINIQS